MRALFAFAFVVASLLAGCSSSGTGSDPAGTTEPAASSGAPTSSAASTTAPASSGPSSSSGAPVNQPPVINAFKVNVTGLVATFTFNATDDDGDALSFVLSFGDASANATGTLPRANATHAFGAAGNYTAQLVVSDGALNSNATLKVVVSSPAGGAALFTMTGLTIVTGNPATSGVLGANGCAGFNAGVNEIDCVFFDLDASLAGHPYTVVTDFDPNADVEFWDSCDAVMGAYISGGDLSPDYNAGVVPDGAGCVIMWDYGADTGGAFTFTVTT